MSIDIGGELPAHLIDEFLHAFDEGYVDITGPTTEPELRKEAGKKSIKWYAWYATANYGECDDLKTFCRKHKLGYVHHVDALAECNASLTYWIPGMRSETYIQSNQDSDPVVGVNEIKPMIDFLLEYAKTGKNAIPLFVGTKGLEDIIEKCSKKPYQTHQIIKKKLNQLLPGEPKLPPFTIKENKEKVKPVVRDGMFDDFEGL
jgi:hypothetical protein